MTDHKGIIGALGIALVTIGLGGYVSLRVGYSISGHHLHDRASVTDLCLTTLWIGVGMLALVVLSAIVRFYARLNLSSIWGQGAQLEAEVLTWPDNVDESTRDEFRVRYLDWLQRGSDAVAKPWWGIGNFMHLHNNDGRLIPPVGSHKEQYRVAIQLRIARLTEIAREN